MLKKFLRGRDFGLYGAVLRDVSATYGSMIVPISGALTGDFQSRNLVFSDLVAMILVTDVGCDDDRDWR